jgi:proteasome lid subunit RPN8/RPN11
VSSTSTLIDTAQIELEGLPERGFPARSTFRIFVSPTAHDEVWAHAAGTLVASEQSRGAAKEVGGVLLGNIYRDQDGAFVDISAVIAAELATSEETQLTFTPDTWGEISRIKDRDHPTRRIVGWYHTHPRFGVFLSERDRFIHRSSFPQPWTVALVVDPVQETEGFFLWSAGEPRLASEYWVGHQRRDRSFAHASPAASAPSASEPTPARPRGQTPGYASPVSRASFALATVFSFLVLLFLFGYVYSREVQRSETEKKVFTLLEMQKQELAQAGGELNALHQELQSQAATQKSDIGKLNDRMQGLGGRLRNLAVLAGRLQLEVAAVRRAIEEIPSAAIKREQGTTSPDNQGGRTP